MVKLSQRDIELAVTSDKEEDHLYAIYCRWYSYNYGYDGGSNYLLFNCPFDMIFVWSNWIEAALLCG